MLAQAPCVHKGLMSAAESNNLAGRMEILEWHQDAAEPKLRYACSVDDPSESCLASRSLFSRVPSAGRKPILNIYRLQLLIEQPLLDQKHRASYLISQQKGGARRLKAVC